MMYPKPQKIVSPKIRKSAKGQRCTLRLPGICSHDSSKVMLCHINSFTKGTGNKSHDIHSYFGCYECHMNECKASAEDLIRAMMETQHIMIQEGLITVK